MATGPHVVRASVRVDGPRCEVPGNVYEVVIRDGTHTLRLNPCSLQLALSFAERWNRKTNTENASVRFVGAEPL